MITAADTLGPKLTESSFKSGTLDQQSCQPAREHSNSPAAYTPGIRGRTPNLSCVSLQMLVFRIHFTAVEATLGNFRLTLAVARTIQLAPTEERSAAKNTLECRTVPILILR